MEMRSGNDVPGKAGSGAGFETCSVVDEVDDHFPDLQGKPMSPSIHRGTRGICNPMCEYIIDCGFGPAPDGELSCYDVSTTKHGKGEMLEIPGSEGAEGIMGGLPSTVAV